MSVVVKDLMSENVISGSPDETVGDLKRKMQDLGAKTIPILSQKREAVGVVSAADFMAVGNDSAPVVGIMIEKVYTIPEYENVEVAARIMHNHKIRHLIVTRDQAAIGIISAFDLLKPIEGRRFEMKNPATPKTKGRGLRSKQEL